MGDQTEGDFPRINTYINEDTKAFLKQVLYDKGYIEEKSAKKWSEGIMESICELIKSITYDVFKSYDDYIYYHPFRECSITIDQMVKRICSQLQSKFKDAPPFTIYRIVELLTLQAGEIQFPDSNNMIVDRNIKGSFVKLDKNLVSGDEVSTEMVNNYHRPSIEAESPIRLNDVYAMRYLMNLKQNICVESNAKDTLRDLRRLHSTNVIGSNHDKINGDNSTSSYSVKLERISWLPAPPSITSNEDENQDTGVTTVNENISIEMEDEGVSIEENIIQVKEDHIKPKGNPDAILLKIKGDVITESNLGLLHQSSPKRSSSVICDTDNRVIKRTRSIVNIVEGQSLGNADSETSISQNLSSPEGFDVTVNSSLESDESILESPYVVEEQEEVDLGLCS